MGVLIPRALRHALPRLALMALVWFTLTGHVLSGCKGLFKPATPEPPSGPPVQLNYSSPEATLKTMEDGMQAKGQGSSAWLGAFADSTSFNDPIAYHQVFDSADLQFFTSACHCAAPGDWRFSQEQQFFLDFLNVRPSDTYAAVFDSVPQTPDPPPGDQSALLYRQYKVYANAIDGNATSVIAIGFADLTFTKIGPNWLITRWVDHVDPSVGVNPTEPDQLTFGRRRLESTR
jgi:hypothetical protein